jgi:VanZ family protein
MTLRTFLKPLSFIPALLIMYMIFHFSGQEASQSSDLSYRISYKIVSTVDYLIDAGLDEAGIANYARRINGVTRKMAHITEYFLLAIAMSFPLYVYGLRGILLMVIAGGICIAYACGDEYHQSFVSGRAASYRDVAIDSLGVLIGIILVRIIGWTGRNTLFAPARDARNEKAAKKEAARHNQMQRLQKERPGMSPEPPRYPMGYRDYMDVMDPEEEPSSDDLSDDMPLSGLLKKK